jgi:hypothetical protein
MRFRGIETGSNFLRDALSANNDIGHFGRLVLVMLAALEDRAIPISLVSLSREDAAVGRNVPVRFLFRRKHFM